MEFDAVLKKGIEKEVVDNLFWQSFKVELTSYDSMLLYYPQRLFEFKNTGSVLLKQMISDVGFTIWDAEILLAHYLDEMEGSKKAEPVSPPAHPHQLTGKTCIELGAGIYLSHSYDKVALGNLVVQINHICVSPLIGCALAAIVASRLGAICCAQELEQVVAHTTECVLTNGATIEVIPSRWGEQCVADCVARNRDGAKFDMVLMADVLYHAHDFTSLVDTIVNLCADNATVFISYEMRRRDLTEFFTLLSCHLQQKSIRHISIYADDDADNKTTFFNIHEFVNI